MKRLAISLTLVVLLASLADGKAPRTPEFAGRGKVNFFPYIDCQDAKLRKSAGLQTKRLAEIAKDILGRSRLEVVNLPEEHAIMLGANFTAERTAEGYKAAVFIQAFIVQPADEEAVEPVVVWKTKGVDIEETSAQALGAAIDDALVEGMTEFTRVWASSQ